MMKVDIRFQGKLIATNIFIANNFWTRLSGYMFRKSPHVPGILFEPANAMQTSFMKFNLDIVFLTQDDQVVKILRQVKPWRYTWFYPKTKKVLEMPTGKLPQELKEGDVLKIIPSKV